MIHNTDTQNITVAVDRIFLDLENPRHIPCQNQSEVIDYLCKYEDIYNLAKDIVKHGLNPLERFALIPIGQDSNNLRPAYLVAEGNRRMCAIKLWNDPELAPAELRVGFRKLYNENVNRISEVSASIFDDREDVRIWLDRIHNGLQGGIGRKEWNAEQKTRFSGSNKNIIAQAVLDYAVSKNLISEDARIGKITTVQRYLSNVLVREALGIDKANAEDVSRNRPENDFDVALKKL